MGASVTVTLFVPAQAPGLPPQVSLARPDSSVTPVAIASPPKPASVGVRVTRALGNTWPLMVTTTCASTRLGVRVRFPQPAAARTPAASASATTVPDRFMTPHSPGSGGQVEVVLFLPGLDGHLERALGEVGVLRRDGAVLQPGPEARGPGLRFPRHAAHVVRQRRLGDRDPV